MKTYRGFLLLLLLLFCMVAPVLLASASQIHVDVGLNHFYKNRYLEAYREFKKAIEIDKRNPSAHYNLGRVYKKQGFIKEAILEFQLAVQLDPQYVAAKRELALVKQALDGDVRTKMKILGRKNVQNLDLSGVSAYHAEKKGREFLRRGRLAEATRAFEQALSKKGKDTDLSKLLGYLKFKQGQYSDALKYYERAKDGATLDPEIYYALGLIYMKTASVDKAIDSYKAAIKLDSNMVKALYALGEAYEAKGKIEDAIFQYKLCLKMNPNLTEAQNKLNNLVGQLSYNYFSRGSYFYQQGDYEQAAPLLELARNYGTLSAKQKSQIDEMVATSKYWIDKRQKERNVESARRDVFQNSYVGKTVTPYEVSRNSGPYINTSVQWSGRVRFVSRKGSEAWIFVNSQPSSVNPDNNMDYSFRVNFPKELIKDARINEGADVVVKGKILRVEKLFNDRSSSFSRRRQPVVEATEVSFEKQNYSQPLVLRFF